MTITSTPTTTDQESSAECSAKQEDAKSPEAPTPNSMFPLMARFGSMMSNVQDLRAAFLIALIFSTMEIAVTARIFMYNVAKYFQKNAILIALMLSVMEFSSHEVFICNIARNLENW